MSALFLNAWIGTSLLRPTDSPGLTWVLGYLLEEKLLNYGQTPEQQSFNLQLTMRGWEKYSELKKS